MTYLSKTNDGIAIPNELSLFNVPPNQVAIEKIYHSENRPLANFTDSNTIEFAISGQGSEYLDLKRSRLYVRAKIVKADGSALTDDDTTSIINLPLQTMWSQIDVYMNNQLVSLNTSHYPWKAYLKTMLSSGRDEQDSQLQSQLFFKDSYALDDMDPKSGGNPGLLRRRGYTKKSREFELEGPLCEDVFQLDKYLIQGVDLYIKLYRASESFVLTSKETGPSYKLQILDIVFKACKIKVDAGIIVNHVKEIEKTPVKYYLPRTEIKKNTIAEKSSGFVWDNMFPVRPSVLVIGLISQKSENGSYDSNPLNFKHYSATEVGLYVNGESLPARPLKLDFGDDRKYTAAYLNLFEACGKINKDCGLVITREDFQLGYALYVFSLDANCLDQDYINLVKHGNVRLEIKFATPLPETVTCIAYAQYSSLLEVDASRRVRYVQS